MLKNLTQARLKQRIHYDPETGVFEWIGTHRGIKPGQKPGRIDKDGHLIIGIDRSRYRASRLAWLYMTGEWPEIEVDHEDVDPSNNRWDNLREATRSQNAANRPSHSVIGLKGVSRHRDAFTSSIKVNGKRTYLGRFKTPEDAHAAWAKAAIEAFGEFARIT